MAELNDEKEVSNYLYPETARIYEGQFLETIGSSVITQVLPKEVKIIAALLTDLVE
jgi:hypothetical protein